MTKELKNAVSRLRKLQDAAFASKIDSFTAVMVSLQYYCRHYEQEDHVTIDVSISTFDEDGNHKKLYWQMTDDICTEIGAEKITATHNELLQDIAAFVDYPV